MVVKQNRTTQGGTPARNPSSPAPPKERKTESATLADRLRTRGRNAAGRKRERLRERLWPGSGDDLWNRKFEKGFATIPRLLPLVLHLIKILNNKGNPSLAYLELWARAFDEHIITITDEEGAAYACGYTGTRAVRTWREHIFALRELGFIKVASQGNREIAHILLLNPISVCVALHRNNKVPEEWWAAFAYRAQEIGAEIESEAKAVDANQGTGGS